MRKCLSISIMFLAMGCKKKVDSPASGNGSGNGAGSNVYVTGDYSTPDGDLHAAVWNDGKTTALPVYSQQSGSSANSQAKAIIVSGSDVYVAGTDTDPSGRPVAKYWKNGQAVILTDARYNTSAYYQSFATGLTVVGSDVYVVGYETVYNSYSNFATSQLVVYWKNGQPVTPTQNIPNAVQHGSGIAVSGNDVYITGNDMDPNAASAVIYPVYWKNDQEIKLPFYGISATGVSIVISGADIYVAGTDYGSNATNIATYWKNGQETYLTLADANIGLDASTRSIKVVGNDIYVAGYEWNTQQNFTAKYWKNGQAVNLTDATQYSEAYDIVISGSDVYVTGEIGSSPSPVYWKNGTVVNLLKNNDGSSGGMAYGIAVKQ